MGDTLLTVFGLLQLLLDPGVAERGLGGSSMLLRSCI